MKETEKVKSLEDAGYKIIHIPHVIIEGRIYTLDEVLNRVSFNAHMFEEQLRK